MPSPSKTWFVVIGDSDGGVHSSHSSSAQLSSSTLPKILVKHPDNAVIQEIYNLQKEAFKTIGLPETDRVLDDYLLKVHTNGLLYECKFSPDGSPMYAIFDKTEGSRLITSDYMSDVKSLFKGSKASHFTKFRKVENLAQAIVYLLADCDSGRLVSLGLTWAEPKRSLQSLKGSSGRPSTRDSADSASDEPIISVGAHTRKKPRCTKCRRPMKGHPKGYCLPPPSVEDIVDDLDGLSISTSLPAAPSESLHAEAALPELIKGKLPLRFESASVPIQPVSRDHAAESASVPNNSSLLSKTGAPVDAPAKDLPVSSKSEVWPSDGCQAFLVTEAGIRELREAATEAGFASAVVPRPDIGEVWFLVGVNGLAVRDLSNCLRQKPEEGHRRGYGLVRVGQGAALGMISTWAALAFS